MEQEVIWAFCWVPSVQSQAPEDFSFWSLGEDCCCDGFLCTWVGTQQSIAAVFEGDNWDGTYTGTGLGTRHAAESGISKSFWLPFWLYVSLFGRDVRKETDIALFITSRRHVRSCLPSLLADSLCVLSSYSNDQQLFQGIFRFWFSKVVVKLVQTMWVAFRNYLIQGSTYDSVLCT